MAREDLVVDGQCSTSSGVSGRVRDSLWAVCWDVRPSWASVDDGGHPVSMGERLTVANVLLSRRKHMKRAR